MSDQLNAQRLESTFETVEAWLLANELRDAAAGVVLEPVNEAEVVEIVKQYEGLVDAEPFVMVEPVFVDRRRVSVS